MPRKKSELVSMMMMVIVDDNSDCDLFAGVGKVEAPSDIEPSLSTCTHLVYGFAVIDGASYKLVPMDEYLELDNGKGYYRAVTSLKKRYPGLNILLSVGGLADPVKEKYLTLVCDAMLGSTLYNTVAYFTEKHMNCNKYGYNAIMVIVRPFIHLLSNLHFFPCCCVSCIKGIIDSH
jgi:hypothetical protein